MYILLPVQYEYLFDRQYAPFKKKKSLKMYDLIKILIFKYFENCDKNLSFSTRPLLTPHQRNG